MENRDEIISIVEATVAAYSNSPVWYKTDIMRYMKRYSDQQNKAKDDKISELEKLYSISDNKIAILNNENQQLQSRMTELQSELKAAEMLIEVLSCAPDLAHDACYYDLECTLETAINNYTANKPKTN